MGSSDDRKNGIWEDIRPWVRWAERNGIDVSPHLNSETKLYDYVAFRNGDKTCKYDIDKLCFHPILCLESLELQFLTD